MKRKLLLAVGLLCVLSGSALAQALEGPIFHHLDVLAPRDDLGPLHQSKIVYSIDYEHRYPSRAYYYLEGSAQLIRKPTYVAALQRDLSRLGYYCGDPDGIFTQELSDAIALFQKNSSMRVTGLPTIAVRRALHLP